MGRFVSGNIFDHRKEMRMGDVDVRVGEGDAQEPQGWNDTDADIEILVGEEEDPDKDLPDEYKTVSKTEILKKMKELETRAQDTSAAVTRGLKEVGAQVAQAVSRPVPVQVAPSTPIVSPDEMKRQMEERFQTDPVAVVAELIDRKLTPAVNQRVGGNLATARKLIALDPVKGPNFTKYAAEIDQIVNSLDMNARANSEVYETAYQLVISRHVDDLVNEAVDKRLKKLEEDKKNVAPSGHRETGRNSPGGGQVRKTTLRFTEEEARELRAKAAKKGLDFEDYVAYAYKKGELKGHGQGK